jgi:hypothetical protein
MDKATGYDQTRVGPARSRAQKSGPGPSPQSSATGMLGPSLGSMRRVETTPLPRAKTSGDAAMVRAQILSKDQGHGPQMPRQGLCVKYATLALGFAIR